MGTDGGPVVALPASALKHWEGSFQPSGGRVVEAAYRFDVPDAPATDYDAAVSAIWGQFGLGSLEFHGVTALVLPQPFGAVRDYTSGDRAQVLTDGGWGTLDAVLADAGEDAWEETEIRLALDDSGLIFFDPAYPGLDGPNRLKLTLNAGSWCVDVCHTRYEGEAVVAARLRREV